MKNVFLDLDNTLISAEAIEDFPFTEKGLRNRVTTMDIHDMDGYYIVFERPDLQNFLDWLFERYNVSVWTAATKDYALFIVENIILSKKGRKLDYILFSNHCDISKKKYSAIKKLKLITETYKLDGYSLDNTIIIDDLPEVYECQPNNAVSIHPFEILDKQSHRDTALTSVRDEIEETFQKLKSSPTNTFEIINE